MTNQDGNKLIDSFMNQRVMIITSMKQTYIDENGESNESVKVINGELLGVEDPFLFVGDKGVILMAVNLDDVNFIELEPSNFKDDDFINDMSGDGTLN